MTISQIATYSYRHVLMDEERRTIIIASLFIAAIFTLGSSNHWVCVSSYKGEVCLFDSGNLEVTRDLLLQIACMFRSSGSELNINRQPVQQQTGTLDCGLFTIAFAIELCLANDPAEMMFSQDEMRHHLVSCFERGNFESFPRMKCGIKRARTKNECMTYAVYCFCRYPDIYDAKMIECPKCQEWYHYSCVELKMEGGLKVVSDWYCSRCSGQGVPEILGKPAEFCSSSKKSAGRKSSRK